MELSSEFPIPILSSGCSTWILDIPCWILDIEFLFKVFILTPDS